MAGNRERRGRGRLSSIDLLPEEAEPDIVWVNEELRAGNRLQIDILDEFNARLADRGIAPIKKSAFSRYSVRKAMQFREMDERLRISSELVESLGTDGADQLTIALTEMIKVAAAKILDGGISSTKGVMELARAVQAAASAQKISAENRRRIEDDIRSKVARAMDKIEDEIGSAETAKPDGAAMLKKIREDIYGIFDQ